MAASQARLSIQGATDEILRRQRAAAASEGARYGHLQAPPSGDMAEFRRQQAEFARTRSQLDRQNSWLAIPALAPAAAVLALEGVGLLAARGAVAGAGGARQPLSLLEREPWWRSPPPAREPLGRSVKAIREEGRNVWARANKNVPASKLDAQVHHSDPLQWAHLKPKADPNRLANLWPLSPEEHLIASREWTKFARELKGREPTLAEVMEAKMRIDKLVAPLVRRLGASRPNPPPVRRK